MIKMTKLKKEKARDKMNTERWIGKREIESLEAYKRAWRKFRRWFDTEWDGEDDSGVLDKMTEILKAERKR